MRNLNYKTKNEIDDVDDNTSEGKSFKYKTKIIGRTEARPSHPGSYGGANWPRQPPIPPLNTEVTNPLSYLTNFWRFLDLPLLNCEVELDLKWSEICLLMEDDGNITEATFQITSSKRYVPVVTFYINDCMKMLENIKQGFQMKKSWNKYRSEWTIQPKRKNLDYMIDSIFRNINWLFTPLFKNDDNDSTRNSLIRYYMPLVEIKDFNALMAF